MMENEKNTRAQISVSAISLSADQLAVDLEMASTNIDRSSHGAVLATDTPSEHHVSTVTDGPSGSTQQPNVRLPEAATSGMSKLLRELRPTVARDIEVSDVSDLLRFANVELGIDDYFKVENHFQTLRSHKSITILDVLFRHNLLFSRAKLYQLFLELRPVVYHPTSEVGVEPTLESTSFRKMDDLRKALGDYSSAMEAYRTFCKEPGEIDSDDDMMALAGMLTELDNKRSQLKAAQESNSKTEDYEAEISSFEVMIARFLVDGAKFSTAGVRTEEESKARLSFLGRLAMAIFGGAALVVPMLIMSLRPSKLTGLLTTSLFVVGVAVALAWFMKDAAPKDVLAATAAYAAVLVVFVGTDGA